MTKKKQIKKPAKKTATKTATKVKTKIKKAKIVATPVPQHSTVSTHPQAPTLPTVPLPAPQSEAQKIWSLLENQRIDLFGLPNQTVAMNCQFVSIDPSRLFVTIRSSAVLPALEALLATMLTPPTKPPTPQKPIFSIEQIDKWVVISRIPTIPQFSGFQQGR